MTTTIEAVERLLSDLVRIDSVTPWLIPGAVGEGEISRFIADWCADLPVEVTIEEVEPGRPNTLVLLRGTGGGPTLCLNAHADTVGYENWGPQALTPRRDGDRLYGRGAADDKAGVTASLLALRSIVGSGIRLRGDLLLALVADEEGASIGTSHLIDRHAMDATIIVEPDELGKMITEHQGFGWVDIVAHGKPAHGSAPEMGVDAIVGLAEIVVGLDRIDRELYRANPDPLNGMTVFHTGTISGGTDYATYPGHAKLGIEIGTQPGETLADRVREIEGVIAEVEARRPGFTAEVHVALERDPFTGSKDSRIARVLSAASGRVDGRPLQATGMNAWADSGLTQGAGIPTVMFGPLGGNFHAPDEWASLSEIVTATAILEDAVVAYLGVGEG
jgi:acetylornithine deacetylase/succinyl-diaminopimelate desuccinylase-like protein